MHKTNGKRWNSQDVIRISIYFMAVFQIRRYEWSPPDKIHSRSPLYANIQSRTDFHCDRKTLRLCVLVFFFLLYCLFCFPFHFRYFHFAHRSIIFVLPACVRARCFPFIVNPFALMWPCIQFVQYAYNVILVISLFSHSINFIYSLLSLIGNIFSVNCWVR